MQRQQRKAAKAASCPGGVKTAEVDSLPEKGVGLFLVSPVLESLITAPLRREVNMKIMGPLPHLERPRVFQEPPIL